MGETVRFRETLRRLAMINEGFVEDQDGLGLAGTSALVPKTAALLQVGGSVAPGYDIAAGLEDQAITDPFADRVDLPVVVDLTALDFYNAGPGRLPGVRISCRSHDGPSAGPDSNVAPARRIGQNNPSLT